LFGFFSHLGSVIKPSKKSEVFLYSCFHANLIFLSQWTKKNGLCSSRWKRFGRQLSALGSLFLKKYGSLGAVWRGGPRRCQKFGCVYAAKWLRIRFFRLICSSLASAAACHLFCHQAGNPCRKQSPWKAKVLAQCEDV